MTHSYEEAFAASLAYFRGDELAARVFIDKYALRDGDGVLLELTPDDMHDRIAAELARVEARKYAVPLTGQEIRASLDRFGRIIPQGSPMFGIGNRFQYSTLSNCYVVPPPLDSYGAIMAADQNLVQISKRRGGVGIDVSNIRPAKARTNNAARSSTGVVPFMKRFSNSIREVGQDGRRGALMITISVHHPEVIEFSTAKVDATQVTGANISVRLSDEFLHAVADGSGYEQRWPVTGEPKIRRTVDARSVWRKIIETAHATAEPGLLFWDSILRESPADCYEAFQTVSTNPCSELPLSADDSCRLLLLNLYAYVVNPFTPRAYFDYDAFEKDSRLAQRLMDDIVDLEIEAIDRIIGKVRADREPDHIKSQELGLWLDIRKACVDGRRTGTGITALADALAAVGVRYGSDESIEVTEKIYRTLKLACYRSSVELAKELGPFPAWDPDREASNPFLLRIAAEDPALYADMQRYGRRNIALLTTAPAGSVSIEARTSSGIEPVFMISYTRRKKINPSDGDSRVDFVDQNGDRWQEFTVYHPKAETWMAVTGHTDLAESPYHNATANDIDWPQRVRLQAAANRHVDHAISSTINLPEDATVEAVAEIYQTAWAAGCKGITVYRDNCRTGVLVGKKKEIVKTNALKRPRQVPCDVHHTTCSGKKFFVLVGTVDGDPYEVIAGEAALPRAAAAGTVTKVKKGVYRLADAEGTVLLENSTDHCGDDQEALLRMVSTSLRHGADIRHVVVQLSKVRGSMYSFARCLARVLKQYIPEGAVVPGVSCPTCGSSNVVMQEGCWGCRDCGYSKCG